MKGSITIAGQKILLPIIRQVYPTLLSQQILGVQPMTGSVGEIFSIKSRFEYKSKYKFSRAKWYYADHRYEDYDAIIDWCTEQFGPRPKRPDAWTRWVDEHIDRIKFRDEKDYAWFMLRWS